MISVTAGPSRQAKLGVSSQISYTVDRIDPQRHGHCTTPDRDSPRSQVRGTLLDRSPDQARIAPPGRRRKFEDGSAVEGAAWTLWLALRGRRHRAAAVTKSPCILLRTTPTSPRLALPAPSR